MEGGADWNTPNKYRRDTPTAETRKKAGLNRQAEFKPVAMQASKYHVKALTPQTSYWMNRAID